MRFNCATLRPLALLAAYACTVATSPLAPLSSSNAGSLRATAGYAQADLPSVTKVKDPLAVEPWAVAVQPSEVVVTNYASDNITVINRSTNAVQNVPVGDGPGGTPDGPFAVAGETYVTLFGSNVIPKKGAPTDYSAVGPGRVQVLVRETDGTYKPLTQISVGKGPRFPALLLGRCKLYVPCGGEDRVDVIDTGRNEKIREIQVGRDPSSCTASIDGSKLYVTNFGDGTVSVIDLQTERKIKDIPAPKVAVPGSSDMPVAQYPWTAAISGANGNLYVTYRGTAGDVVPNGAIVEIDTCSDEVVRTIVDDLTHGTPSAEIAADGGGLFGVASCRPAVFFTNDALGAVGMLDARIDQVISPFPFGIASCPRPRGVACVPVPPTASDPAVVRIAYVACGQPDNEVLVIRAPALGEEIPNVPVIESLDYGGTLKIRGKGFVRGMRVQVFLGESPGCLAFEQEPKVKKGGTLIVQKGRLTNGRKLNPNRNEEDEDLIFRLVNPDGTAHVVNPGGLRVIRACPR